MALNVARVFRVAVFMRWWRHAYVALREHSEEVRAEEARGIRSYAPPVHTSESLTNLAELARGQDQGAGEGGGEGSAERGGRRR